MNKLILSVSTLLCIKGKLFLHIEYVLNVSHNSHSHDTQIKTIILFSCDTIMENSFSPKKTFYYRAVKLLNGVPQIISGNK